jgi:cytochrome P450
MKTSELLLEIRKIVREEIDIALTSSSPAITERRKTTNKAFNQKNEALEDRKAKIARIQEAKLDKTNLKDDQKDAVKSVHKNLNRDYSALMERMNKTTK